MRTIASFGIFLEIHVGISLRGMSTIGMVWSLYTTKKSMIPEKVRKKKIKIIKMRAEVGMNFFAHLSSNFVSPVAFFLVEPCVSVLKKLYLPARIVLYKVAKEDF